MAAIDLIAEEPIRFVSKRIVSCDGGNVLAPYLYADTYANIVLGGGALGHPKVYINLVCSDLEWRKSEYTGIHYAVPIRTSLAHMPADTVSFATYVEITLDCCTKWPVGGIRFQKQDDHHH